MLVADLLCLTTNFFSEVNTEAEFVSNLYNEAEIQGIYKIYNEKISLMHMFEPYLAYKVISYFQNM